MGAIDTASPTGPPSSFRRTASHVTPAATSEVVATNNITIRAIDHMLSLTLPGP
jgi:hypothetical protein